MNRTRTIRAILAAPIISAGVLAATVTVAAPAAAQPATGCSSMAMPANQAPAGSPNMMTRAGQVGMVTAPQAGSTDGTMDCNAASHG